MKYAIILKIATTKTQTLIHPSEVRVNINPVLKTRLGDLLKKSGLEGVSGLKTYICECIFKTIVVLKMSEPLLADGRNKLFPLTALEI